MVLAALLAGCFLACLGAAVAWAWRPARKGRNPRATLPSPETRALMLANCPLGMAHIRDRKFIWLNARWAQILGLAPGHLEGMDIRSYHLDQAAYESFGEHAYQALAQGGPYAADIRLRRVDGTPFWAHMTGHLLIPGQPEAGAIWCLEDVTARVEAQEELTEVLTLNQKLIASSPTGILLFRAADGTCILANEAASPLLEPSRGSLLHTSFRRQTAWKETGILEAAERALATGAEQKLEAHVVSAQGEDCWLDAQFVPFASRGERLLLLLAMDVSARVRAGKALQDSQDRYRVVVDALNEGLAIVGKDQHFTFVNERLAKMLGYRADEILGQFHTFILAEEDLSLMEERQRSRPVGARDNYEIRLKKKSGETLEAVLSVAPVEDGHGRPLASPVLVTDISVRKRAEREREALVGELKQKNKELETLVYVASHDLRSPLVNIQGFSSRLGKGLEELKHRLETSPDLETLQGAVLPLLQERLPAALGYIRASGVKMDAIINGLLQLSRAGRLVLRAELLDMNQLLQTCAASLAFQLQAAAGTVTVEALPSCLGDPVQIAQVFSNLLDNAIKYRSPGLPLRVRVLGRLQGKIALYTVEDNGLGIPEAQRERIWEIFQRLDPTGPTPGEGLGLTLVRRMVERNGGRIWVEGAADNGCCFHVELPAG